ncbi:MAG: glycosyltransferase [Lachnospiraceae bacterium]|nr:MAG: glycosyltransferase [Lachnospiraceae bacterium]
MDKREPLVSIVMPIYNSETYLDEAILSIIHQTYKNWELLIINEFGSNEEGKRIINRYAAIDSRIRLIQNSERLGIAESLNEGLRQAKGEYIARMDGDDISLPERIEKQVEFMESNNDILLCGVQVEVFGSEKWDWKLETDPARIRTDALFYSPCVHPTILFRRDVINKYNVFYNKDYKASEDYDFFTRILEFGEIANLKEVLFKYRLYGTNATYINNNIGFKIYSDVMERHFHKLGIDFSRKEVDLLSVHYSLKGLEGVEVLEKMVVLDLLLKKIFYVLYNKDKKFAPYLFKTLHRRFKETYDWLDNTCKYFDKNKAESIYKNSVFYHDEFYVQTKFASSKPKVSVLLPVYNSEKYIAETLWSLFEQTFSDFEVLVLNEYGSSKEGLEVVKMFEDDRIRIIQNKEKLGLADSLNLGMREAKGEYLARIDGDDLARNDRFALQVKFLDKNRAYGLVGSLQHHFGVNTDYIHDVPKEHKDILAGLIYDCLVCHSTIMMRKKAFIDNDLFYDKAKQAEDYELWTRACKKFKFYNIPEILGEYRVGEDNITKGKLAALSKESGELAGKNIKETLGVEVPATHIPFLSGWINEFESLDKEAYKKEIVLEQNILEQMWDANKRIKYYDADALLRVINKRWRNITNTWEYNSDLGEILPIDRLFKVYDISGKRIQMVTDSSNTKTEKVSFKERIKDILRFLYTPFKHGIQYRIRRQLWDLDGHLHESTYDIKKTVWDIEGRIKECIMENIGNDKESNSSENLYERLNDLELKMNTMMEFMELKLSAQEVRINSNIVKSKDSLSEQLDTRVWKAETNLGEQLDARVWKAESNLGEQLDARVWKAESNLGQQIDGRIWKAENNISDYIGSQNKYCEDEFLKLHRHLDFSYSDIFVLLDKNIKNTSGAIELDTKYPVAYESNDYLVPHGTVRDDTRYPRFIHACEMYFKDREKLAFVDLGCSSGGIVLDALLRGHEAVGLEGSDESFKQQRAQWRIIPKNLFTCDITKPFTLKKDGKLKEFDVISAWEVLEHIKEEDLPVLLENIKKHLNTGGIFIGSIANWDDIDEETGVNWHVNLHPYEWWRDRFVEVGFEIITEAFSPYDLARGTINPPHVYELPYDDFDLNKTFYIVAKKQDKEL